MANNRSSTDTDEPFDDTRKLTMALGEMSRAERENIELGRRLEAAEAYIEELKAKLRGVAQTPAHLEELAQWADAAVEFFPVHGEKFKEIARVLRSAAQPSTDTGDLVRRLRAWHTPGETMTGDVHLYLEAAVEIERLRDAAQAGLNPGMREALERIRDFPIGGHTAAGAMALIARQALATGE
jgi:hypothetical protein